MTLSRGQKQNLRRAGISEGRILEIAEIADFRERVEAIWDLLVSGWRERQSEGEAENFLTREPEMP